MGLFSLQKAQGDLTLVQKYLIGWSKEGEARFFLVVPRDRSRGSWHKLK